MLSIMILMPNVYAFNLDLTEQKLDKAKYLVVGFFPKTTQELCIYYIIPGILWAQVNYNTMIILWLGDFFVLGITNERPEFWFGKMP